MLVGPSGTPLEVDEAVGEWRRGGSGAAAGTLAGRSIERAVDLALQGKVQGIVTAPLDNAALLAGGYDYPGEARGAMVRDQTPVAAIERGAVKLRDGSTVPAGLIVNESVLGL